MTTNQTTAKPTLTPTSPVTGKDHQREQELRNKYESDRAPPSLRKFAKANKPSKPAALKFSRDW